MNHPYKLTVKLRQYTPLLHFQGDTEGACLRASEVKPKLDRFVWDYLDRNDIKVPESWQLKTGEEAQSGYRTALRYKMRIAASGIEEKLENYSDKYRQKNNKKKIHALYFASMGQEDSGVWDEHGVSKTKGLFFSDGIDMTLLCLQAPELLPILQKLLPYFFALSCFGNRSNKGFGSFTVASMDGKTVQEPEPEELIPYLPEGCPALYFGQYQQKELDWKARLDDIQAASAIMKGGMNYTIYKHNGDVQDEYYYKGALFHYFMDYKTPGVHSEKAMIKRDILPEKEEDRVVAEKYHKKPIKKDDPCLYMRGVLGLAQTYEYRRKPKIGISRDGVVRLEGVDKDSNKKPLIARFGNPVHFKPYGCYMLLIPHLIPEKLFRSEMRFYMKRQGSGQIIRLPSKDQFDLDEFLTFFAQEYQSAEELNDFNNNRGPVGVIYRLLCRIDSFQRIGKEG